MSNVSDKKRVRESGWTLTNIISNTHLGNPPDLSISDRIIKFDITFMKAQTPTGTILFQPLLSFTQLTAGVAKCPFVFESVQMTLSWGMLYDMVKIK